MTHSNRPIVSNEGYLIDKPTEDASPLVYKVGFEVAEIIGRYSFGPQFTVTRDVAQAIVEAQRELSTDDPATFDNLAWWSDSIVHTSPQDLSYVQVIQPDGDGCYDLTCGWAWSVVEPEECATVVRAEHAYVIGLPVGVTVDEDGVHLRVDAAEVSSAIRDEPGYRGEDAELVDDAWERGHWFTVDLMQAEQLRRVDPLDVELDTDTVEALGLGLDTTLRDATSGGQPWTGRRIIAHLAAQLADAEDDALPNTGPRILTVRRSDVDRCPKRSLAASHYRADGSCRCDEGD